MTDPSNDYANGDGMLTLEDIEQEAHRLTERWSDELDRDVTFDFSLKRDEWAVYIDGIQLDTFLTVPQMEDALTTYMNGGS